MKVNWDKSGGRGRECSDHGEEYAVQVWELRGVQHSGGILFDKRKTRLRLETEGDVTHGIINYGKEFCLPVRSLWN